VSGTGRRCLFFGYLQARGAVDLFFVLSFFGYLQARGAVDFFLFDFFWIPAGTRCRGFRASDIRAHVPGRRCIGNTFATH
jgi:hypothetical protein